MSVVQQNRLQTIGIVSALHDEAKQFSHFLRGRKTADTKQRFRIVQTGIGDDRVEAALESAFTVPPCALIVFGTAAGLNPQLAAGDLVIYNTVQHTDETTLTTSRRLNDYLLSVLARLKPRLGAGLTSPEAICLVDDKRKLRDMSEADCVDMESATIARWALPLKIPVTCLRVIVDTAQQTVPDAALAGVNADGTTNALATCMALCKNPQQLSHILPLARHYKSALNRLRSAAGLIVSDLDTRTTTEIDRILLQA